MCTKWQGRSVLSRKIHENPVAEIFFFTLYLQSEHTLSLVLEDLSGPFQSQTLRAAAARA